ncbi:MAG: hypothetical protein BJ554DRAFT_7717 [Olpidium bornovanus]|uniref:Uncharacterized protein n=1 Tax=Olpidium bornovanus TaxID=278681 RepID=A0A8H7ZVT4_9FUNG|nr:MAG: hypothetical protein BJ554DRAFT_7717 [Olpidium bornovanus]
MLNPEHEAAAAAGGGGGGEEQAGAVAPGGGTNNSSEEWLLLRVGTVPRSSLGWFRCGVGFYNKKEYPRAIECFQRSVQMDPLNQSVNLDNPSDWQLLVELTASRDQ